MRDKNRILIVTMLILFLGCDQQTKNKEHIQNPEKVDLIVEKELIKAKSNDEVIRKSGINFSNGRSRKKIELSKPTVLIVQMDSLEIEQVKKMNGESIFYTATDDLMWYNAMMIEKMDSLKIDVKYTDKDTVDIVTKEYKYQIIKDTTFMFYTHFYFNGKDIKRKDLFELIGN